jgi:hypothetical protein
VISCAAPSSPDRRIDSFLLITTTATRLPSARSGCASGALHRETNVVVAQASAAVQARTAHFDDGRMLAPMANLDTARQRASRRI